MRKQVHIGFKDLEAKNELLKIKVKYQEFMNKPNLSTGNFLLECARHIENQIDNKRHGR